MNVYESVADAIGATPLIRLAHAGAAGGAPIWAKVEFLSVGGSVKDRAALSMIDRAERDGSLRPGGTIVEATSGNTGIGLAIVGRQRGYRVIVGVSDRSAREKVDILRAYGAEVVLAPTALPRQDPGHLFNVVRRLTDEIPGAWLADQYDNPANPDAHVRTTGPEIWEQTGGRVTHFVAGVGTGGTISGVGAYLKQVSDGRVTIVGADPENSVYAGGDGSPYFVESIGHFVHPGTIVDEWPASYDTGVADRFERIPDRESLLTARRTARDDGLLVGPSSGTAIAAAVRVATELGPDDLVVVLLPDSGRSYLSKLYDDEWLRGWGFLEDQPDPRLSVRSVLDRLPAARRQPDVVESTTTVGGAARGASGRAVPVVLARTERRLGPSAAEIVGSVTPSALAAAIAAGSVDAGSSVADHLAAPLPTVGIGQSVDDLRAALRDAPAAVVLLDGVAVAVLDRADVADAVSPAQNL